MDEVNVDPIDICLELIERVQSLLSNPPIVLVTPILNEALQVRQVRAVVPSCIRQLVRKTPLCQPPFQVGEHCVRNLNLERDYCLSALLSIRNLAIQENSHQHGGGEDEPHAAGTHFATSIA